MSKIDPKKIAEWEALVVMATPSEDDALQHDGECDHGMWWADCPNAPCAEKEWEIRRGLADAVDDLGAEREDMLALLREVEWSATVDRGGEEGCPVCGGWRPDVYDRAKHSGERQSSDEWRRYFAAELSRVTRGHAPDCRLAAFLKE